MFHRSLATITLLLSLPLSVPAQTIGVKTMPLIMTQQFSLLPSYNAGMGGVSIGLDDALADGFRNPARITTLERNLVYLAPYRDSWRERLSDDEPINASRTGELRGSQAQALPFGVVNHLRIMSGSLRLTTAFALSIEQLRHASHRRQFWNSETGDWNGPLRIRALNLPLSGIVALQFPGKRLSVGAAVDAVVLRGVDGTPMLYPGANGLHQKGSLAHYRLGASLARPEGGHTDFLVLHKRYRMEQDATYDTQPSIHNKDSEKSWLVQLKARKLIERQAHVGFELTGQWKWHPKIPDYPAPEISIPRDPGITKAGRIGVGFSNREGKLLFALDAAMEIIDSKTWGDTTAAVTGFDGEIIAAGDPLFSNDYFFINSELRVGIEYRIKETLRLQAGWSTRQYSLDFFHEDFVTGEKLTANPQNWWSEPALTGGLIAKVGNMEWIYYTRVQYGTGSPSQEETWWGPWWGIRLDAVALAAGDLLAPPTGMAFQNAPVVLHRLTVVYWFPGKTP